MKFFKKFKFSKIKISKRNARALQRFMFVVLLGGLIKSGELTIGLLSNEASTPNDWKQFGALIVAGMFASAIQWMRTSTLEEIVLGPDK